MILTRQQEAELVTAIQGRGEIPLKFVYLGEGASNWDKIAGQRTEDGGINSAEAKLLYKRVEDFVSTLDTSRGLNIIDIGCGNGYPIFPVLKHLAEKNIKFTYVPLDISQEMLDLAIKNVEKEFPQTECKPLKNDFELGQFSDVMYELKKNGFDNLMLFLGSTLGNHSDLHRVLTNFRDSMTSKDYMIVGVELTNLAKSAGILHHYQTETVENFVSYVLDYLKVSKKDYKIEVSWNDPESRVEIRSNLENDISLEIGEEKFVLHKGEKLLLSRSKKFNESVITKLLSDVGFRTELLTTSEDRGYLLTMVQPTRYSV
jgi:uncharacterized SAM-dependent methyltransferase